SPAVTDASLRRAADLLGLRLRQPELLRQALAVPAAQRGRDDPLVRAKERLEYLGDSIIGFLVTEHLFTTLPEAPEGVLSALRAATVSAASLARLAEERGVAEALGLPRAEGERGRTRLLAATLEALVGALYCDAGLDAAHAWIGESLILAAADLRQGGYLAAKTRLQERTQEHGRGIPRYFVVATRGAEHERTFDVAVEVEGRPLGRGQGPSRRAAEQAAAEDALARLD